MSRGGGGGLGGSNHGRGSRTGRGSRMPKHAKDNRSRQLNPKDTAYWQSRSGRSGSDDSGGSGADSDWRGWMDEEAARRIQSSSDKTGNSRGFKGRAQAAADRNSKRGRGK